jgi:hypothetical protein
MVRPALVAVGLVVVVRAFGIGSITRVKVAAPAAGRSVVGSLSVVIGAAVVVLTPRIEAVVVSCWRCVVHFVAGSFHLLF